MRKKPPITSRPRVLTKKIVYGKEPALSPGYDPDLIAEHINTAALTKALKAQPDTVPSPAAILADAMNRKLLH